MACSNKWPDEGISDLYHGSRRLVGFPSIFSEYDQPIDNFRNSACAAAMVKTSFLPNYGKTGDFLWDSTNLTIWTV